MARLGAIVLALALSLGCSRTREGWVESAYPGDFPERIGETWRTPTGIAVDGAANPHEIDWIVDNVTECLQLAVPGRLTIDESRRGLCFAEDGMREPFQYPRRSELVVKIASWHPSCANPKRQVLDVAVPEKYGCDPNKPRPDGCPATCWWRGGYRYVDGRNLHIQVPELSMFADTLVRSITACQDPYAIDRIKQCAAWRRFP